MNDRLSDTFNGSGEGSITSRSLFQTWQGHLVTLPPYVEINKFKELCKWIGFARRP
jgi:hypothetical protein